MTFAKGNLSDHLATRLLRNTELRKKVQGLGNTFQSLGSDVRDDDDYNDNDGDDISS